MIVTSRKLLNNLLLEKIIYKFLFIFVKLYYTSKTKLLCSQFNDIGTNTTIDVGLWVNNPKNITVGSNVFIGKDVDINAYEKIDIGDHCLIAAGCKLISGSHSYIDKRKLIDCQGYINEPIELGRDVWLGYGVVVLPGVKLGDGCVVAAGSVVTKNFPENSVVAGLPAKLIKMRQ